MKDVKSFCWTDVNGELIQPLWRQDSKHHHDFVERRLCPPRLEVLERSRRAGV